MSLIFQGLALGIGAGALPGPFQTYLVTQSLRRGWRYAMPLALTPLLSDAFIIGIVLWLLSQFPPTVLNALQLIGGSFILYLAFNAWRGLRHHTDRSQAKAELPQNLIKALLVNTLSPYPYIFWSTVNGPILIAGWQRNHILAIAFLLTFYLSFILTNGLVIFIFGKAGEKAGRFSTALLSLAIGLLAIFGILLLWHGAQNIFY